MILHSQQEKQSRSYKEMYESDKKGDNISQSHFLLLLKAALGKSEVRMKGGA